MPEINDLLTKAALGAAGWFFHELFKARRDLDAAFAKIRALEEAVHGRGNEARPSVKDVLD
jgi:hypothetical protein